MGIGIRMTRAEDWLSIPPALAVVLVSLNLAGWALVAGSRSAPEASTPASASAAPAAIGTPLARYPGALMLAERSRDVLIGLAARPGGPVDLLPISSDGRRLPQSALCDVVCRFNIRMQDECEPMIESIGYF